MKTPNPTRKPNSSIRIAVVEDHALMRELLVNGLKKEPNIVVSFHAANGKEFFEKLANKEIEIAIVDLEMPEMDGKEVLEILQRQHPDIKVIILSMHTNIWMVAELIQMGAKSYMKKNCTFEELVDALYNVKFKGYHTSDIVGEAMFLQADNKAKKEAMMINFNFSERDLLVIRLICSGSKSTEIAERLHLTRKSIDGIRARLFKALNAKTPADFARKSIENGLYQPIDTELSH